jgi:hypothetical protein
MEQIVIEYLRQIIDGNPYLGLFVIAIILYIKYRFREITGWNKRQDRDIEELRNELLTAITSDKEYRNDVLNKHDERIYELTREIERIKK